MSTSCTRRSPNKKQKFVVTCEEMNEFFKLLHHPEVQHFLKRDSCCLISDKYALAMVFTYFKRAKFNLQEYTLEHFYLALYLASDIEEDVDEYKYEIFPWALGNSWRSNFSGFLRKRDALLRRIGYRAIVSRKCCEEVMSFKAEHDAWKRERAEDHGGATRAYLISRSKRFLSSNLDDEDLNYPRLAHEAPRPCPLCLLNRGWNAANNSINSLPISSSILSSSSSSLINKHHKLSNITNTFNSSSVSISDGSSLHETTTSTVSTITNSPRLHVKVPAGPSIAKRQRQSLTNASLSKEGIHHSEKVSKPPGKTPKKSISNKLTVANKLKHQQKHADEIESSHLIKLKAGSKLPASNKFNKIKLSITELENSHRGFELPARRSSLASTEKLLIKDKASDDEDDDEEDEDEDNSYNDGDDTTDEVFSVNEKPQVKSQMTLRSRHETLRTQTRRSNTGKLYQINSHGIRKRNNCSLSSSRNLSLQTTLSTSNSSSRLELDWCQQNNSIDFNRTIAREVYI